MNGGCYTWWNSPCVIYNSSPNPIFLSIPSFIEFHQYILYVKYDIINIYIRSNT